MASELFFTCPETQQRVPTGIETDVRTLSTTWSSKLKVSCPLCGETHEICVREVFIDGVLDDVSSPRLVTKSSELLAQASTK